MRSAILFALATAGLTSAHFTLNWPASAGFVEENEPVAPCGGATPQLNSSNAQISVDQFSLSIRSSHPAGTWAFFATTDETFTNFTRLVPNVTSTGAGSFCLTGLHAPASFANKSGVIQIIDYSADGTLYQCAPVNFISGANTTIGSACTNTSGFSASFAGSASSTTPAGSTSTSHTPNAAAAPTAAGLMLGGMGLLAAGLLL